MKVVPTVSEVVPAPPELVPARRNLVPVTLEVMRSRCRPGDIAMNLVASRPALVPVTL
jgi:hypothetical protein